jgi:hypothetical protein
MNGAPETDEPPPAWQQGSDNLAIAILIIGFVASIAIRWRMK